MSRAAGVNRGLAVTALDRPGDARNNKAMLELRPNCECCDRDLPPGAQARICSFECTFCPDCAEGRFGGVCPNCGGELVRRPVRPRALLDRFPPSTVRVTKPHAACGAV